MQGGGGGKEDANEWRGRSRLPQCQDCHGAILRRAHSAARRVAQSGSDRRCSNPDGNAGRGFLVGAVVREFQAQFKLGVDGLVGPETTAALEKALDT